MPQLCPPILSRTGKHTLLRHCLRVSTFHRSIVIDLYAGTLRRIANSTMQNPRYLGWLLLYLRYACSVYYFIPGWGSKPSTNSLNSPGPLFLSSRGDSDSSPRHRRVPPATCAPDAGKTGIHLTTPEQGPKIIPQKLHVSVA